MSKNRYYFIEIEGGLLGDTSRAYADAEQRDKEAKLAYQAQRPDYDTLILVDAFVGIDGSVGITVESADTL